MGVDAAQPDAVRLVDGVDIVPLGHETPFSSLRDGILKADEIPSYGPSKIYSLAYGSDFESMLFSFSRAKDRKDFEVATMLPRGFVEDMSHYANVVHDSSLGAVVVEHRLGRNSDIDGMSVSIKLFDENNQLVGDGYLYPNREVAKAIFFNVPPGQYSVVVESSQGDLLASQSALVFSDMVSKIDSGAPFKKPRS